MKFTVAQWPDEIHLIGAGGIGSHVLLALIELGATEVHVWDDDIVEAHNRPNQFVYTATDIGRLKVEGMVRFVERQAFAMRVIPHQERVTESTELSGIIVSGVDSMMSRKSIWQAVLASAGYIHTYVDGRIGDELVHMLTVDPCEPVMVERYEKTLLDEGDIPDRGCTTRENPHSALAVASMVSINLTLRLAGEPVKDAVYRNLRQEAMKTVQ